MTRSSRVVGSLALLVLLAGLAVALLQPLWQMRSDIDAQRGLLVAQVETTRAQLEVARQQLVVARDTRDATKRVDARTAELLEVSRELLAALRAADLEDLGRIADQLLEQVTALERTARETEGHAESIDRKTGPRLP